MTRPRNYQTEAIVIKKTKLGEADRILTLYTLDLGKISAVAKGVRRPKSKMSGHLELLTHSLISLARGRNLETVTGCQTINSFMPLKSNLELSARGLYVAELVDQFTGDQTENSRVFELLLKTMASLCTGKKCDLVLRWFELHLLEEVGYRPQLERCVTCSSPLAAASNWFSASAGGMLCPSCCRGELLTYSISSDAQQAMRTIQSGDPGTALCLEISSRVSQEIEEVLRRYLKYLLERDLKSIAWLDAIRQSAATQRKPDS